MKEDTQDSQHLLYSPWVSIMIVTSIRFISSTRKTPEGRNGDWPGQYGNGGSSLNIFWIMNYNPALALHYPLHRSL